MPSVRIIFQLLGWKCSTPHAGYDLGKLVVGINHNKTLNTMFGIIVKVRQILDAMTIVDKTTRSPADKQDFYAWRQAMLIRKEERRVPFRQPQLIFGLDCHRKGARRIILLGMYGVNQQI
jgi:hypothetical protein